MAEHQTRTATELDSPWLTMAEAIAYLRLEELKDPVQHISRARQRGDLQARMLSRELRFHRDWLDDYLINHCKTGRDDGH